MDAPTAMAVEAYRKTAMAERRVLRLQVELENALGHVKWEDAAERKAYAEATEEIDRRIATLP